LLATHYKIAQTTREKMKKESINQLKLGVFVFVGIGMLVLGIYFIGETKKLFSSTFRVSALFKNVNGLQVGNNIRFAGINVGAIDAIEIVTDTTVRVDMVVDATTQKFIKKDATASIGSDGLMGNKIMNLSAGSAGKAEIEDQDTITANTPMNMDEILIKLKITTDNASLIMSDLASITGNIRAGNGTIGKLFMDTLFAENLDRTIMNVKDGSKGFKQNMDAAQQSVLLRGFFKNKKKPAEKTTKK
jgi:phospholipid/cholesterol/gamma-HCH transport system substrate-binding protein